MVDVESGRSCRCRRLRGRPRTGARRPPLCAPRRPIIWRRSAWPRDSPDWRTRVTPRPRVAVRLRRRRSGLPLNPASLLFDRRLGCRGRWRPSETSARACVATSMHTAQSRPCGSHSRDVAAACRARDEAVFVAAMAAALAAAEARHVAQHLGMLGGEDVERLGRPPSAAAATPAIGNRRQDFLRMRLAIDPRRFEPASRLRGLRSGGWHRSRSDHAPLHVRRTRRRQSRRRCVQRRGSSENERGCSGGVGVVVAERVWILADDFRAHVKFVSYCRVGALVLRCECRIQ